MISLPAQMLELTGPDTATFAHAQFCNDVLALPDGHWQWNVWLSPQGRVRAFFHLLRVDAANIVLILRGGGAQWLCAELSRYVFRAKVRLRVAEERRLCGSFDAAQIAALAGTTPRASAISRQTNTVAIALPGDPPRWLLFGETDAPLDGTDGIEPWRLADIRAGLPEIGAELRDQLLPQWIGLDRLNAVSVRKGCYPGQEIMARLHFKGGNKRSLYRLRWKGNVPAPPGTSLHDSTSTEAGIVIMAARDPRNGSVEALASLADAETTRTLRMEWSPALSVEVVDGFA